MSVRRCGAALLAIVALVAAGCGGDDAGTSTRVSGEPVGFDELAQSATSSGEATSGRFAFDMSLTFPGADGPVALSGEGAFDAASKRASIAVDMSSLAKLLGGFLAGLGGTAGSAELPDFDDPTGWKIEVIQDGAVGYVRFPAIDDRLPKGKTWVRGTANDVTSTGLDFDQLESFARTDPRELLDALRSVSGEVTTVGSEELRGVETTHYRASLDPAEIANNARAGGQADAGTLLEQLATQTSLGDVPLDVWIDRGGLVRKLSLELSATQGTPGGEAVVTFELWDYGEPVRIELPPASHVVDASAVGG